MGECRPYTSLSADATAIGKVAMPVDGGDITVNAFLGIPYSHPPVGELRFCAPQPKELWKGERDCTKFGAMCVQPLPLAKMLHQHVKYPDEMSEDCLFLNVYTTSLQSDSRLPVMVWLHGGAFVMGTGEIYDGTALVSFNEVVVVTVNYRVGLLGFFTTGDDVVPGNNGLLDQLEALRWVQKYITSFGGDPGNVTIFGESAGGLSCSLHVLSDMAAGLFHRVIIQSGPATSPYTVSTQQKLRAALQPMLEEMGYRGNSSDELVAFLRRKPAADFTKLDLMLQVNLFKPVIDGHYLKDYPHNLYAEGRFLDVDMVTGCCSHEGYISVKLLLSRPGLSFQAEDDLRKHVRGAVQSVYPENTDDISNEVYKMYFTDKAIGNADKFKEQFSDMTGDMTMFAPQFCMTLRHSGRNNLGVFVYTYAHRASFSEEKPGWIIAEHGDDIIPTFGIPFITGSARGVTLKESDRKISRMIMKYWTNFAKTGNPNGNGLPEWSPFDPQNKAYLMLRETPEMATDYQTERMEFFRTKIPELDTSRPYKPCEG